MNPSPSIHSAFNDAQDDEWLVNVADAISIPSAPPEFVTEDLVPANEVTLLAAHGGVGKSMLMLLWAIHAVLGLNFLGRRTVSGAAVFYSGEDPSEIVRFRLGQICRALQLRSEHMERLGRQLHIADASAQPTLFLEAWDREIGRYHTTSGQHERLRRLVTRTQARHVFVDNGSSTFSGNEIQRQAVDQFIRSLRDIARRTNAGVVLAVHVDKATARGDEGRGTRSGSSEAYSGSSQWHNACRSRLFLRAVPDSEGELILSHGKSNHGRLAPDISLVRNEQGLLSPAGTGYMAQKTQEMLTARLDVLLCAMAQLIAAGQNIPTATTGGSTTHKALQACDAYPLNFSPRDTSAMLIAAQRAGRIKQETYRTSQRKEGKRWVLTS